MNARHNAGWRALVARGFAELSPPEAEHAVLELATNRAEYIGLLEAMGDYPARSPIGHRVPTEAEVQALCNPNRGSRAVVPLDDEAALTTVACLFDRALVLDPLYDSGALLYAAWHDPLVNDEHARCLAEHAGLLVRAAPLLNAGVALLAPDHLPGSWNPRPGWRKPRRTDDTRQVAAWWMRTALVLVYWANRLDAIVCTTRVEVVTALDLALTPRTTVGPITAPTGWRLALGEASIPEPALLIRRVLNGQDPDRKPRLPRKELRRGPLCLLPLST